MGKKRSISFEAEEGAEDSSAKKPTKTASSRRDSQREVAQRRAAHFARADPVPATSSTSRVPRLYHAPVSSTPTGFLRRSSVSLTNDDDDEENVPLEAWPGPFSTARDMIAKRDAARKAREEAIAARGSGDATASYEADELLDEYDRALKDLVWPNHSNATSNGFGRGPVISLTSRCATILAQHFDRLQGNEIGYLQIAEREKVAVELCKLRRCDAAAALKLAVDGSQYLVLPECSEIDEDTLMKAMEQASGVEASRELEPEEEEAVGSKTAATKAKKTKSDKKAATTVTVTSAAPVSALRVLKLKNCGRGMSDRSAAACINLTRGALELLQLTGCYRLNDSALCSLLQASASTLLSLDLSCNSRLGPQALRCIRSLPNLLELTLDNCTHLCDDDLLHLVSDVTTESTAASVPTSSSARLGGPPPLTVLSLVGLTELTDASIVPLIRAVGGSLQSLHLSGCVHLTDRTIRAIRRYCGHLQSLGLGQLSEVSAEAMVGLFIAHPAARRDSTSAGSASVSAGYHNDAASSTSHTSSTSTSNSLVRGTSASSSSSTGAQSVLGFTDADDEELDGFDEYPHIGHLSEVLLQGNVSVTDDVIIHLAESNKRTLRTLDVNGCHQLTSRSAAALRMHSSRTLHSLDLSFVRGISQESLGALVDACVGFELEKITVWGCTQLGEKFFKGHSNNGLEIIGRMTA